MPNNLDLELLKVPEGLKGLLEKYSPTFDGNYWHNLNIDSCIETIEWLKQSEHCTNKIAADELISILKSLKK